MHSNREIFLIPQNIIFPSMQIDCMFSLDPIQKKFLFS